jgi:hypothetical protein
LQKILEYKCQLCKGILRIPASQCGSCAQSFCNSCIKDYQNEFVKKEIAKTLFKDEEIPCPTCESLFVATPLPISKLNSINSLKFSACQNCSDVFPE